MMTRIVSRRALPAAAALAVLAAGCGGPKQFDVTGKVTYNGSPLTAPGGQIIFIGPKGEQAAAEIGPDGTYRVAGVWAGPNKVAVYYTNPALTARKNKPRPRPGDPVPED